MDHNLPLVNNNGQGSGNSSPINMSNILTVGGAGVLATGLYLVYQKQLELEKRLVDLGKQVDGLISRTQTIQEDRQIVMALRQQISELNNTHTMSNNFSRPSYAVPMINGYNIPPRLTEYHNGHSTPTNGSQYSYPGQRINNVISTIDEYKPTETLFNEMGDLLNSGK